MKNINDKNIQLSHLKMQNKYSNSVTFTGGIKRLFSAIILLMWLPFTISAQLTLPAIPDNSYMNSRFELSNELIFRIKVNETYLTEGALIAYIHGEIRGAQTTSVLFPLTGITVYKISVFNDKATTDTILFKYYDISNNKIYSIKERIAFVPNQVPDYSNPLILNAFCEPISKATGLIPENSKENLNATVDLFWQPSPNATYYNLFVWIDGTTMPVTPTNSSVFGTSFRLNNLKYGQLYRWKIESVNGCSSAESAVQTFRVRQLPDLTVSNFQAPASIQSGSNFQISFNVKNIGGGNTAGASWTDAVFVSKDQTLSGDDILLSGSSNVIQLDSDSSYLQTATVSLPLDYKGNYYFIVNTDNYNSVFELSEDNNVANTANATSVSLKPLPDIQVIDIQSGTANINPGDSLTVNWKVENIGGAPATGGWIEKISLIPVSGLRITFDQGSEYKTDLAAGGTVNRNKKIKLPDLLKFSGQANIEIELIPFPELQEYPANTANNKATSANRITVGNLLYLDIQTASVVENTPSPVRCIITRSGNYSADLLVSLSVSLSGQISIPASATIPANQSSIVFNLNTIDNALIDGARDVQITAVAVSYTNSFNTVTILDDEIPWLAAQLSRSSITEGDTITLTVTRNLVTNLPLTVSLSTNKPSQWTFPSYMVILANTASATVSVTVTDDNIPELTGDAIIYAISAGVNTGNVTASIIDNDVPQVSLELLADTVSESAGVYATWGVVKRVKGDDIINVNLSSTLVNSLFFPASVSLPKGQIEQKFNIGVVDNALVDGYRKDTITGSVLISSCNCGTSAENGGAVAASLVIADNDGPSLSISINPLSLPEGKQNAGILSISRNTPTDQDLPVTIVHNDDSEVNIQTSAIIFAGQTSVMVPINTKNDNIEDGSQMVSVQANAASFTSGYGYVFVTDQNKPDLEITNIALNVSTAATNDVIEITGSANNNGFATAPSKVSIYFYCSKDKTIDANDILLGDFEFPSPITQGTSVNFTKTVAAPDQTGNFFILAKINPTESMTELIYFNNISDAATLTITPAYNATAIADNDLYMQNTTIPFHGSALNRNSEKVPNVYVDVYILSNGTRRELKAKTNSSGDFTVEFVPIPNESGHFSVGACFPEENLSIDQDQFDIPGIRTVSSSNIIWDVKLGQVLTGKIGVKNTSGAPLNKLVITADKLPSGCQLVFDTISSLPGNQSKEFSYTVKGNGLTTGKNYEKINFRVKSIDGVSLDFPTYYYCQAFSAQLLSEPVSINTTMTKGKSRMYELHIYNNGAGESGTATISLPDVSWMTLVSPATIPNMAPRDTAIFILNLTPSNETQLNTPLSGNIAVNCTNGTGAQVPYRIEAVSEEYGGLKVDVIDEYTYYTEAKPHLKNAHVVVRHPFSGIIMADGFTDENGIFTVDSLPEGSYKMNVEANKHEGYQTTITIDPGRVNEQSVFISFQAITYTWEVVPTQVQDQYEVQLIMKYETSVPVPVVIVEMPDKMPQLFNDETYPFIVTMTNKGLITAKDVELTLPQDDPEYEFVTNFTRMDLLAQQAIQVPVVMKRRAGSKSASNHESKTSTVTCANAFVTIYGWECGKDKQWHQTSNTFTFPFRTCNGNGGGNGDIVRIIDGGGGGPLYGHLEINGGGISSSHYDPYDNKPYVERFTGCEPCLIAIGEKIVELIPIIGPAITKSNDILECLKTINGAIIDDDLSKFDPSDCGLSPVDLIADLTGLSDVKDLVEIAIKCYKDPPIFVKSAHDFRPSMPPILKLSLQDLMFDLSAFEALDSLSGEIMGNWTWNSRNSLNDFNQEVDPFVKLNKPFSLEDIALLEQKMAGTDITIDDIHIFTTRWNNTVNAWSQKIYSPTTEYPDILDKVRMKHFIREIDSSRNYAVSRGYDNIIDMYNHALATTKEQVNAGRTSVCASVSINITQKVVMTREAFEGTLTIFNGHTADAMKDIKLNLEIKDENGVLSNDLFQINTKVLSILTGIDGTGTLAAQQKGSATVLFIPEKGAAPTVPKSYSFGGSFSYLDPFTGVTVTKPLFPVTLDVNPSPDLFLHYFMQRNIFGDDPLTVPIEPIVPAEFAVMIQNNGYGTAQNVRIESAQPKIVENEKGLSIHFALIGSNLNGQPCQLGLTNIDFGNIAPKKATIGQWWFTSDLLGHFVNYEAKISHQDSRGNPDLSLISGVKLHELIKSISVYSGVEDEINDFLANEVQDAKEFPDVIYLSNGGTMDVYPAPLESTSGSITSGNHEIELIVTPKQIGWNYIKFNDPGDGNYKIASVTREDGQVIPLDNVWQTNITLPDSKEPVYENIMHFLDVFAANSSQKYALRFTAKDLNPPEIVRFENVPASATSSPLSSVNVIFNKPIDPATFNYEDMTLRVQGGVDIIDKTVIVTQLDPVTFRIDLTSKSIENGYYVLTVQASQISDLTGTKGKVGKQATWTQFINVPAIREIIGLPDNNVGTPMDFIMLKFNLPIDKSTLISERFLWKKDTIPVSGTVTLTPMDAEGLLFRVSGLSSFMTQDGKYSLTVDLPNIKSLDGKNGILPQSANWQIDQTAPLISQIIPSTDGGYDLQHRTAFTIKLNESVKGFGLNAMELWKDGLRQPLSQLDFIRKSDSAYLLTQFRMLTYYEGSYMLNVKMKDVTDLAGNSRSDTVTYKWIVYRTMPKAVTDLHITPDMGFSDTDNITSTRSLFVTMLVKEPNTRIQIYQTDKINSILLADTANVIAGTLTLPVNFTYGGNQTLQAYCTDIYTNQVVTEIPVTIDEAALVCTWKNVPLTALTTQPNSLKMEFSDKLLDDTKLQENVVFERDGQSLGTGNLAISKSSDKLYLVSGMNQSGNASGLYSLSINLSKLQKYSSGKKGISVSKTQWSILSTNRAPLADAGADQLVNNRAIVTLDASASSDADGNPITYKWTGPVGITLSSVSIANPTFTAPEVTTDTYFTFYLVVNDGLIDSKVDQVVVTVKAGITSVLERLKVMNLKVYPSPFKDKLYFDMQIKQDADVRLEIYNILGSKLQTIAIGHVQGDKLFRYEYLPDRLNNSQMIIYRLVVNGEVYTDKVFYLK